jgi:hypothetical protein
MEASSTELISTRSPLRPKFLYSCRTYEGLLHRVNLITGEQTCLQIPAYEFKFGCRWTELPGGSLLITGGDNSREVVRIDTLREYAVSSQAPMHTARRFHAAVYHSQYLFVLGGWNDMLLSECERYVCAESRWEELPALPVAGESISAVELENSLYALGGKTFGRRLDTVQKFSLDSLTWELMQLKLPQEAGFFPCFKTDTQVYLVINETLYSFTPNEVKPVKTLGQSIITDLGCYSRCTLYYANEHGLRSLTVGELR